MTYKEEIVYQIIGDKIDFDPADNFHEIEVEFEAYPEWENDSIGSYEYWGFQEIDYGHDYVTLYDAPTWNKALYTDSQNTVIQRWLDEYGGNDYLSRLFCEAFKEDSKNNC